MLYLAKGSFWVAVSQTTNSALSLILIIAFANLLPKETFGIYQYILSIAGILNIFTLSGMNNAVARSVAKGNVGVLLPAIHYQLKWNLFMFFAFCILGGYYFLHNDSTLATSFIILGLFIPATLAFNTYGSFLEGKKEFKTSNILSALSTLTYSVGMLLILFLTQNVILIIAVYALATFLPSFIFYRYTIGRFAPPVSTNIHDTLAYGRELTYLRFIDPVVSQIDKIILVQFWGPTQLALYSLALAIPNRATLFMKSWVAIGFPKFTEKTPTMINVVFWRRILQGMSIGLIITMLYVFVSPYIFTYVLPQYIESIVYSQLLSINFIFALPNRYMSLLFTSQRLSKVLLKRTLIQSILAVLLYIMLGIWGGLLGLVCANLMNTIIGFSVNIFLWKRVSKIKSTSGEL